MFILSSFTKHIHKVDPNLYEYRKYFKEFPVSCVPHFSCVEIFPLFLLLHQHLLYVTVLVDKT